MELGRCLLYLQYADRLPALAGRIVNLASEAGTSLAYNPGARGLEGSTRAPLFPLDRALTLTPSGPASGHLYLKQSSVFRQQGDIEGSIGALRRAIPVLGADCIGRSRLAVLFSLALNFDQLGRSEETLALIPEVRELATELRNEPDLLRVLWLETRARIALGEQQGADASLDQIRRDFKDRGLLHDAALAGLDLAVLYLDEERPVETRELATELAAVFRGMGIKREQLAAVWLFLDSAEKEAATAEQARQAATALRDSLRSRGEVQR